MPPDVGKNMKLYRNTGTHAIPVWSEIDEIGDLSIPDLARSMAELKRRGNAFTKNVAALIQSIAVEFRFIHGLDATNFDDMITAFFAGTAEEYAIMNADITTIGTQGFLGFFYIENFPWDQPLEEISGHDIRLALAYVEEDSSEIDPEWYTIEV